LWRLVFPPGDIQCGITYQEAVSMDADEIMEANAALDLRIEQVNKERAKTNKRRR